MASLTFIRGPRVGYRVELVKEQTRIGRDPDCEVVIPISSVGRVHSRITRRGAEFVLEDAQSRSGTFLNNECITGPTPLRDGDRLRHCDFVTVFNSPTPPVTEAEWLGSPISRQLLEWLRALDWVKERSMRLFVAACYRRFGLPRHQQAAGSLEDLEQLAERSGPSDDFLRRLGAKNLWWAATEAADHVTNKAFDAAQYAADQASDRYIRWNPSVKLMTCSASKHWSDFEATEDELCRLLRDLFGNPFRASEFSPSWRTAPVTAVSQAAYEERDLPSGRLDTARLAVLSDALEEAGCADEAVLSHLRSPGPHVRGCWALDLVLGKK